MIKYIQITELKKGDVFTKKIELKDRKSYLVESIYSKYITVIDRVNHNRIRISKEEVPNVILLKRN